MSVLTADRNTPERKGDVFSHPVQSGAVIFMGALLVLDAAGNAAGATAATGLTCVGRADDAIDNGNGNAGDLRVYARKGVFRFAHDGSINRTHVGKPAYLVDDQTLASTDGGSTRSVAGSIENVDAYGVWLKIS